ncbi:putative periplasmic ligand-binding sensor protein [Pseudomonas putida S11]|nr:putative periplasmic ligand-binding sensor protein [Pseudomonas putida S11]
MNTEEQTLIDGLFGRLKQAEDPSQPRDAQAQACIEEHVRQQPAAPYYMAQAILVQEAAIKRLDEQNKQLEAELKQARAHGRGRPSPAARRAMAVVVSCPASLVRLGAMRPRPCNRSVPLQPPVASGGGWREPSAPGFSQPQVQQPGFGAAPARSGASSFLGGAMQTAAGVAGGVLLAQGISSLFNHNSQPEEVVEVIKEEPAPASDSGGWNDSGAQQQVADNGGWGSDQGGYADSGYGSDDGGFFSDDDSYV